MTYLLALIPVAGIIALLTAFIKAKKISSQSSGTEKMQEISSAISKGAKAFLFAEYKVLVIFVAVLSVLIGFLLPNGWLTALCFIIGALFSTFAGYFGMVVATKANVRTANAAREHGMNKALSIAFNGGAVIGLSVVGLGVIGLGAIFLACS